MLLCLPQRYKPAEDWDPREIILNIYKFIVIPSTLSSTNFGKDYLGAYVSQNFLPFLLLSFPVLCIIILIKIFTEEDITMSLFDNLENILDKTDLDEKILAKAGLENGLDEKTVKQVKELVSKIDLDKIDFDEIAKKTGVSADLVKKITSALKK